MFPVSSRDGKGIGAMNALAIGPQADKIGRENVQLQMTSIVNRSVKLGGGAVLPLALHLVRK
jgi:hypothetical protein